MKIFILFILLGLVSCERSANVSDLTRIGQSETGGVYERTIDSCQYIRVIRDYTHKGNCNNPIHKCPCK
jgi:hypothetical protein